MRRNLLCLLFTFFFFLACQISEEEKINQILNRREEAFQKKDLSLYLSFISKDYQDKDEDYHRLQNRIRGYFKSFEQIQYSSWDRSIQIEGEKALVVQNFQLEVEKGGKKNQYSGKEALFFRKEGRKWMIIKGL